MSFVEEICLAISLKLGLIADEPNELNLLAHFVAHEMSWAGQLQIDELSWAELGKDLKMMSWAEPSYPAGQKWWAELSRAGSARPARAKNRAEP